jgi:type I restriction enzyme S subunit
MSLDALSISELQTEAAIAKASKLPEGWARAKLGEILPLEYGKALPERLRDATGRVAVYGSSGRVGSHTAPMVAGPTLIVGRKGSAGAVFYCSEDCWPIDTVYFAKPTSVVNLRYGFYFLKWKALGTLDQSTAIPSLSRDSYSDVVIPVAPLPEQRRIVARIDELFAEIADGEAALTRARQGLDTWRRALLKAAVTGELTRDWREANRPAETGADLLARIRVERCTMVQRGGRRRRPAQLSPIVTDSLPTLPEGWVWASLGDLFDVTTGSTPSRAEPSFWGGGTIPWVSSGEVAFCRIKKTRERITSVALNGSSNRVHPPGTVLLAMIGEGKTRGQCAILDIAACNNQNSAAIRVGSTPIQPQYIYYVLQERYYRSRKESRGGNQPALNAGKVASMAIPLPSLEEIGEMVRRLDDFLALGEAGEHEYDEAIVAQLKLRQSVLKAAFEGRLVPQNPADESASVMLGRLRDSNHQTATPRRRARAKKPFSHPSLPGLTRQSLDPRVEPVGDD